MNNTVHIMLVITLTLQIIAMLTLLYSIIKRHQNETRFYQEIEKIIKRMTKNLETQLAVSLDEAKENTSNEPEIKKE